jgi:hypothetical protein
MWSQQRDWADNSGAAIWTVVINKDAWLKIVKVENNFELGIFVYAGPTLCECSPLLFSTILIPLPHISPYIA